MFAYFSDRSFLYRDAIATRSSTFPESVLFVIFLPAFASSSIPMPNLSASLTAFSALDTVPKFTSRLPPVIFRRGISSVRARHISKASFVWSQYSLSIPPRDLKIVLASLEKFVTSKHSGESGGRSSAISFSIMTVCCSGTISTVFLFSSTLFTIASRSFFPCEE